jgi:serine/threonine protein kinase
MISNKLNYDHIQNIIKNDINKYKIDKDNIIYSVLKINYLPNSILSEIFKYDIDFYIKYNDKNIIDFYYDYLMKSNPVNMGNNIDNFILIFNKTPNISNIFLKRLLDEIDAIKKKYITYNVIEKVENLYNIILKKCEDTPSFFYSILNKFKLCSEYNKSLYYLNKLILFKSRYVELFDSIKIKINYFEKNNINIYKIYFIYNKILYNIKKKKSDLDKLLLSIDENIYNHVFLSENSDTDIYNENMALNFVKKIGYNRKIFTEIENMKLKRGFIVGIEKDNTNYILKYQPNKSISEIVINNYFKKNNLRNVLTPTFFYLNTDNSYFCIIKKYDTDLYKYFNILEKNNKLMTLDTIIKIFYTIIASIKEMKKNNVIHTDLKLENTVLKINSENSCIEELKIIDFDLSVFNEIPENILLEHQPFKKTLLSKRNRGTKTYMKKCDNVTFHNDIYSLGMMGIILLYKTAKMIISNYNSYSNILEYNKKFIIKNKNIYKEMMKLRDKIIEENNNILLLNLCVEFFTKLNKLKFNKCIFYNNIDQLYKFKNIVIDCFNESFDIDKLYEKHKEIFVF